MPGWAQTLAHVTDAERFPRCTPRSRSEAFDQDDDTDDEFVFGLARILDGVAALIAEPALKPARYERSARTRRMPW